MGLLDSIRRHRYSAALLGVGLWCGVAWAELVSGAQLPEGSSKVGEHRYRAPDGYDETLKYYRSVYPPGTYPRRTVVNQPGVKAVHITNPSKKGFEGLNIYEANDEVRIFIVEAEPQPKPKPVKLPRGKGKRR